jgi:hypothetical protein
MSASVGNAAARKEALALHLAAGRTVKVAARRSGVSLRTAHAWRSEAAFRARVAELQARLFSQAAARLSASCGRACVTLRRLLRSDNEQTALRAADCILTHSVRLREAAVLAAEVARLRAMLEGRTDEHGDPAGGSGEAGGGPGGEGPGPGPGPVGPGGGPDPGGPDPGPLATPGDGVDGPEAPLPLFPASG